EHAPLELRFAREKLVAAQAAHDDKDYAAAARLAEHVRHCLYRMWPVVCQRSM
ncbi:MAG: DUF4398 domain-containing protein, partial [Moorea sp. SIO3E2]|nr:DUF4398 domain-containing protein [Moorena sp. SIO3E2]